MTVLPNDKATARSRLTNERVTLGSEARAQQAARACRALLARLERLDVRAVAAYVSTGVEPATGDVLDTLWSRGVDVLLPVLLPDGDLDWSPYTGARHLAVGRYGIRQPDGERLGTDAVLACEVMVTPALAVDARGVRLGRGGGSYDRVLARAAGAARRPWTVALLYEGEAGVRLPVEPHDRAVDAAATPSGIRRFGGPPDDAAPRAGR